MVGLNKMFQMIPFRKTEGWAFSEILIWLTILIAFSSIGAKFVPVYLDHRMAVSIVEGLAQSAETLIMKTCCTAMGQSTSKMVNVGKNVP